MKMHKLVRFVLICCVFVAQRSPASADVSPGEMIDKTNCEKAQGLLPESLLNWVKKGDMTLDVQNLNFNSAEFFPPPALKSLKENIAKYDLDENDTIVESKTMQKPGVVMGIPFPAIEVNDPKAGAKIMVNGFYYKYALGNLRYPFQAKWIGASGFEREVECDWRVFVLVGHPGAQDLPNPEGLERYAMIRVLAPFDIAGTNVLLWRYLDARADSCFSYVPAIRRVRRMSPANRSDAFIGTDIAVDDSYGFDGKVGTFSWKLLRKQEALLPFVDKDPSILVKNEFGEWQTTKEAKSVVYGYQKEGHKGGPWLPINLVWAKREAYVIAMAPKDPYYNYGPQEMWVDAENFWCTFKVIHDRANVYWKTFWVAEHPLESADKELHWIGTGSHDMIDDRRQHASILECIGARNVDVYYALEDRNDYSIAGFQKLCK